MRKVVITLWLCWWWVGQCFCQVPVTTHTHPGFHLRTTVSSTGHNAYGQWRPSLNNSPTGKSEPSTNISQPAPGINENTHHNIENTTPSVLPGTPSEKVHNGGLNRNASEHVIPSAKLPMNTSSDDHDHDASKNISSGNDTARGESGPRHLPDDLHSENETHTHIHDHNPVHVSGDLPVPESSTSEQPAPDMNKNTQHRNENTPPTVLPVTQSEKVHNGGLSWNSSEHVTPAAKPLVKKNRNDLANNASTNLSSGNDTSRDEGGPKHLPDDQHSEHETHTHGHDHNPVYVAHDFPVPESSATDDKTEVAGGSREGHGRVTTTPRELCSFCLCDKTRENVFCKHDHVNHLNLHSLEMNHQVIPPSAKTLRISGFERVEIASNTFSRADLRLNKIHFENIPSMKLFPRSLHFSPDAEKNTEVAVKFTNCTIPEMPQYTLTQLTIKENPGLNLKPERTRFMSLTIDGCVFEAIRSYALFNVRIWNFHMTRTKVVDMEENSIHLDSYNEWIIENSQLPNMIQKSICLHAKRVVVFSNNTFLSIGNRSLTIVSSNPVLFEFNNIIHLESEALLGIQPDGDLRAPNFRFFNNTIHKADERSLLTDRRYPIHERKILDNKFKIPCDCQVMRAFGSLLGITNINDNQDIMFQTVTRESFCQVLGNVKSYVKVQPHMTTNCTLPITIIAAGTAVGVVLLILVVVCVVCNRRVQKARDEANYLGECSFSQSFTTLHCNPHPFTSSLSKPPSQSSDPTTPTQPWVMAVPEIKTYKETELNVSYERTEPMNVSMGSTSTIEPGQILDLQRRTQIRASCPFN